MKAEDLLSDSALVSAEDLLPKEEAKSLKGFASNVVANAQRLGHAAIHPFETIGNMADLTMGGIDALAKTVGIEDPNTPSLAEGAARQIPGQVASAARHPLDYAYQNPLDAMFMASGGLSLVGKGLGLAGGAIGGTPLSLSEAMGGLGSLSKTDIFGNLLSRGGEAAGTAAKWVNPISGPASLIPEESAVGNLARAGAKQAIGTTTGAGVGAVEEALKGGEAFTKAMRGEILGEEIVGNAKAALQTIKDKRATEYRGRLAEITKDNPEIDISPIQGKFSELAKRYGIKEIRDPETGALTGIDTSRSALNLAGRKDIQGVFNELKDWGSQVGDDTAIGLDTLKRRFGDFYSESSQARGFVKSLRDEVKNTIIQEVPEYAKMTKGYSEASNLIKDIESGLMMRKTGISGRVVADQTLRRLTSAMRENFEMRRDLVNALGAEGGRDIAGQVAGYAMSPAIPRGLVGKLAGGTALFHIVNPKMWPVLAASSPRIMGEFLKTFGAVKRQVDKITEPIGRGISNPALTVPTWAATKGSDQQNSFLQQLINISNGGQTE